jgi:hypothetical protein
MGVGEPYYKRILLKAIIFDARVISQRSRDSEVVMRTHAHYHTHT